MKAIQDFVKGTKFQSPYIGCNEIKWSLNDGKLGILPDNKHVFNLASEVMPYEL